MSEKSENIREKFMSLLLRKSCTRKQAEEFLSRQKVTESEFDALMNEAEELGLIDDLIFAKLFIDGHLSWGNLKISHELSMRGVSRENINLAFEDAESEIERASEIVRSLRKTGIDERKIMNRLLSRGFSSKAVRSALNEEEDMNF